MNINFIYEYPGFRGLALKLTGSEYDADDLLQETAIRLIEHGRYKNLPETELRNIAYRVMRNRFYDEKRLLKQRGYEDIEEWHEVGKSDIIERLELSDELRRIDQRLNTMHPYHRKLVVMRAEGFSYKELQKLGNSTYNTVVSDVYNAREFLSGGRVKAAGMKKENVLGDEWSEEDTKRLIDNYRLGRPALAKMFGRNIHFIHKKANELGLRKNGWSDEELNILKEFGEKLTYVKLAKMLPGRSARSILNKRRSLGIVSINSIKHK